MILNPEALIRKPGFPWRRLSLVDRAALGDAVAFDELMASHRPSVAYFLSNKVAPDALDDLLQEITLAVWESLPRLDRRDLFRSWLFGIAMNKTRAYWRRRAREDHQIQYLDFDVELATDSGRAFRETESNEVVRSLLEELSQDQREVMDLYYRAELNLSEVATALGRNVNTVKYQFYRAHERLADHLTVGERP